MLGRGRLRRGVSLEVIVEEDDSAEVMLDPTPIMENDDEGHDEDDEDDSENGGSTPGSPSGSGGGSSGGGGAGGRSGGGGGLGGGGGGGGRSSSGAEERRKKRERRRTIGGLSRVRSVSCEALTLLDTSDMDSCCSEWDDDDDMSTGSSNYVTLNRPISRRRILESTQSQCDSEDSGIEYQSNEDDPALEDQSSIEDRKDVDQSSVDIHEQETATESDDDDDAEAASEPLHNPIRSADDDATTSSGANADADANITVQADAETIMEASADADAGTSANAVESSGAASNYVHADVGFDTVAEADAGTTTDADRDAITNTEAKTEMSTDANADADADIPKHDAKAGADPAINTDAAGEDVLLSAKTGKHLFEERSKQGGGQNHTTTTTTTTAKYLQDYTANEVLENDKLVIVETTPPVPTKRPAASQRSVDAAEEELQLKRAAYTIRNKEVQLEELPRPHTVRSVKQLFEDLKTPVRHFHAWRDLGRFRDIKSNPSSKILRFDRSDSIEAAAPGCLGVGSSFTLPHFPRQQQSRASPRASEPSTLPKVSHKSQHQQEMATTKGGQSVMLRKPMVRGFNVKKALMEDPRTFHPNTRGNQPTANTRQQPTSSNKQTSSHQSRKNHVHFAKKSQHSSDATTDRSDTESLASDISEDSGVSNDSNTSTASSGSISTYRAFDAYTSDPSFKWIDPAIMAKIRAVGTTVIFFGPRPRPRHHDGTVHRSVKSTPSGLQVPKGGIPAAGKTSNTTVRPAQKDVSRSSPVPAPRIVGVVRKRNPNTSGSTPLPAPVPASTDPCSDHSRASTPGRCQ